jgi:hypothetical protein
VSTAKTDLANATLVGALDLRVKPGHVVRPLDYWYLRNSARVGALQIFRDQLARPIGYVAWAMINRASLNRIRRSGRYPTYPYEWNEGAFCLILDVMIVRNCRFEAIRKIRDFAKRQRAVVYTRKGRQLRILLRRNGRLRVWQGDA